MRVGNPTTKLGDVVIKRQVDAPGWFAVGLVTVDGPTGSLPEAWKMVPPVATSSRALRTAWP